MITKDFGLFAPLSSIVMFIVFYPHLPQQRERNREERWKGKHSWWRRAVSCRRDQIILAGQVRAHHVERKSESEPGDESHQVAPDRITPDLSNEMAHRRAPMTTPVASQSEAWAAVQRSELRCFREFEEMLDNLSHLRHAMTVATDTIQYTERDPMVWFTQCLLGQLYDVDRVEHPDLQRQSLKRCYLWWVL